MAFEFTAAVARRDDALRLVKDRVRPLVPSLFDRHHKGQHGCVAVIGGSTTFTGAPYYAAISSLRVGADLSFVFCQPSAATPIKSYSPELMVQPLLPPPSTDTSKGTDNAGEAFTAFSKWLPRIDSLVIGPGLGRDLDVMAFVTDAIVAARNANTPVVLDADGLWMVAQNPDVISGYAGAVLTPNIAEFRRLWDAVVASEPMPVDDMPAAVATLSAKLGNVTIVCKGATDVIHGAGDTPDASSAVCAIKGSPRRCGGQGDVLAGCIGTFVAWARRAARSGSTADGVPPLPRPSDLVSAALGGCAVTRHASRLAFGDMGRSQTTPDIITHIGKAFLELGLDDPAP